MVLAQTAPAGLHGSLLIESRSPCDNTGMMKIAAAGAQPCSTVIWDVGGTLVDRVVGTMEALARALGAVGLRREAVDAATLERAHQHFLSTEPCWGTLEEERQGFEEIAAIVLEGTDAAGNPDQIARL